MAVFQDTILLTSYSRGFHLITRIIETRLLKKSQVQFGIVHIFIHHTSASLTINENADRTVRKDFESHFNIMVPENQNYYLHNLEGPDDMPAHIKSSLLGSSVTIPIRDGKLVLGTWQGVYLCEHRNDGGGRTLTITAIGE